MEDLKIERVAGGPCEVPREQWRMALEDFSRRHENQLVSVEVASSAGRMFEAERLALKSISVDRADGDERIYVLMGNKLQENVTHTVKRPTAMRIRSEEQPEVSIASAEGKTTVIRLVW